MATITAPETSRESKPSKRKGETPEIATDPNLPFEKVLSLAPLLRYWTTPAEHAGAISPEISETIARELEEAPELWEPITDLGVLDRHRRLVEKLMSAVFPPALWERDVAAAFFPYYFRSFYATPKFQRCLVDEDGKLTVRVNVGDAKLSKGKALSAYSIIAQRYYGFKSGFVRPLIFSATDPDTGFDRHFKVIFDSRFIDIVPVAPPELSDEDRLTLERNMGDLETWQRLIPAGSFEIHGFSLINAIDVTDNEEMAALTRDLIENDSISSRLRFSELQQRVRGFLRRPDIVINIAAVQDDQLLVLNTGRDYDSYCILTDSFQFRKADLVDSVYERALTERRLQVIGDLLEEKSLSDGDANSVKKGYRTLAAAPLIYQDEAIGVLSIGSPNPYDLDASALVKLYDILPLFAVAVARAMEDLNNRVQRIIREEYTAVHPSVEWRFRQAAQKLLMARGAGKDEDPEPILFPEVYPLYNVTDIRGSSTQRNEAIRADLLEQLEMAKRAVQRAREYRPLAFLSHLTYRIDKQIAEIADGIGAGDEANILHFLNEDVESLFDHLATFGREAATEIEAYRASIDPELGVLYRRRRDYDESVAMINHALSAYVEAEEAKAQELYPHYFEKHETDGIDISVYVGESLVDKRAYDPIYLRELRLWQLMISCGLARVSEQTKPQLKVPLDTAHLILVQTHPLSIRFRLDEKHFDVDGAYNIRYEIMKKRIDKATLKGTEVRLTQPGKIAIVYSQAREAQEYREYIEFLTASGYLTGEIEELELEDLQGVTGLRALRVTVV